jgi:hypothetical protein
MQRVLCDLPSAFTWCLTIDGTDYWNSVFNKLAGLKQHGTSDYKPVEPKQPEITDEWLIRFIQKHGRRPLVHVRDVASRTWSLPVPLIAVSNREDMQYRYRVVGDCCVFCKLADGEPLE